MSDNKAPIANSSANIPLAGLASDGWSSETEATATCFCGEIQIVFPTGKPGLVDTFVCNCTDCRKITASMFASNFIVHDSHRRFVRGESLIHTFAQRKTIESGNLMTNHFCSNCGTLMFRVGSAFPGKSIMRIGTVDDFTLHETKLKPRIEQYTKDRVAWLHGAEGVRQVHGSHYNIAALVGQINFVSTKTERAKLMSSKNTLPVWFGGHAALNVSVGEGSVGVKVILKNA